MPQPPSPQSDNSAPAERKRRVPKPIRILLKTIGWFVGIVLLLLVIIILAIQLPSVQNKVLGYAIPTIEEMLGGANVEIAHIDLKFFDAASVDGILIEDLNGDTLAYANTLSADIGAFSLFGGEIFLDEIAMDGAVINAYQLRGDSAFNYQFILDAFAPSDTVAVDTAAAAFDFGLRTVDITNTRIRLLDEQSPSDLRLTADRLLVDIGSLDLESLALAIDNVAVEGITGSFVIDEVDPVARAAAQTATDTTQTGAVVFDFPYAGMPVSVDQLSLKQINFAYRDANTERVEQGLDAGNIEIIELNAQAESFAWDSTQLSLVWNDLSFRERSGLTVDQLSFALDMTPDALALRNFKFNTDASQVLAQASLDYDSFADFAALNPTTYIDLTFSESYLAMSDLRVLAPTLREAGLNLDANANLYLDGRIDGTLTELELENASVRIGKQTTLAASGTIRNALDPDQLAYNLNINRLTSSYSDLNRLTQGLEIPPELAEFGQFRFSGQVAGTTTTFRGTGLDLRTAGRTGFKGQLALRNIDDPDNLYIDADVASFTTNSAELAPFVPDSLGIDFDALGDIDFQGNFAGTVTKFDVDGALVTDLGSASADLVADLNADYTAGTYTGTVDLDSFQVGTLLQDTTLGTLSLSFDLDGEGLTPETIASSIDGSIESFTYLGYTYHDIAINGNLDRQLFEGAFSIDDPNVKLSFDGLVNMRDSIPDMVFEARLDTIALQPLNLYPTPLGLSLAVSANLRGNSADNLVGRAVIDSFYLQDSSDYAFMDSLLLRAGDTSEGRFVVVTSPLLDASIIGDYNTADLPILLTNYVNDYFPIDNFLNPTDKPADLAMEPGVQRVIADQSFEYAIALENPYDFLKLFDPAIERLDTVSLTGQFDSREKALSSRLYLPDLVYDGIAIDTILAEVGGDLEQMLLNVRTARLSMTGFEADLLVANAALKDKLLTFDLDAYLEADSLLLRTGITVNENDEGRYVVKMDELFKVAGQEWMVDQNNEIEYFNNYLDINNLIFRKDGQSIAIESDDESADDDIAPITVIIDQYQLSEVARLVQLEDFSLTGLVNGKLSVREPLGEYFYTADLDVQDIILNEQPVGTLIANASSDGRDAVGIDVRLDGPVNDVAIVGEYGISDASLDLRARIKAFELRIIDPLAVGVLDNTEGILTADLTILGTTTEPVLEGFVALDDAETTVGLTGARYHVNESRIDISERLLDFNTLVVADSAGREATLSGQIAHDYFVDFDFDLAFSTDGIRVLNTEPTLTELYYGEAIVAADVAITGTLDIPVVRGTISTEPGTDATLVPLLSVNSVTDEAWVIYADPVELAADTTQTLEDVYKANALGLDLALIINVDDEATLHIIVDPTTGDALVARGNSELNVQMTPDGAISMTGLYTISEGGYQFTLKTGGLNVKKYNFEIVPGSTLRFVGDPLDSRFSITAIYETQTPTFALLESRTQLTPAEEANAKRRQDVEVEMSMKGTLEEPEIDLGIELPQSQGSGFSNTAKATLEAMTEQEIYQQVFSLLVFNSFSGGSGAGGFDPGAQAEQIAISSISNLVNNQLNSLADNYLGGFNVDIGIESYENQYLGRQNTANLDVSRTLFSDRLTVTFGTDVNVGSETTAGTSNAGGFQSNFVVAYRLTESGRYRIRVFRRPDYDIISSSQPYENGIGISYQREFD